MTKNQREIEEILDVEIDILAKQISYYAKNGIPYDMLHPYSQMIEGVELAKKAIDKYFNPNKESE